MKETFIWVEKYRPRTIQDCILPNETKAIFQEYVTNNEIPNLLLAGTPGIGKTTVAQALCDETKSDYMIVNGSLDLSVDVLRTKINQFASTVSLMGDTRKMVIIDEADYMNAQHTQPAIRRVIEEFSGNCGFIFTCNHQNKIIDAIKSRCSVVPFTIPKAHRPQMAQDFFLRVCDILAQENIVYDKKVVAQVIQSYFPDFRRTLNELQAYSAGGSIDSGILSKIGDLNFDALLIAINKKTYDDIVKWVVDNMDNDPQMIYRRLYDCLRENVKSSALPQVGVTLAKYQYQSAFVADTFLHLVACLTELMVDIHEGGGLK